MYLAFLSPSPMELAVIAVIALIVLGPSRLPEAARSLGKGMREMRDSFQSATGEDDHDLEPPDEDDEDSDLAAERHDHPAEAPTEVQPKSAVVEPEHEPAADEPEHEPAADEPEHEPAVAEPGAARGDSS